MHSGGARDAEAILTQTHTRTHTRKHTDTHRRTYVYVCLHKDTRMCVQGDAVGVWLRKRGLDSLSVSFEQHGLTSLDLIAELRDADMVCVCVCVCVYLCGHQCVRALSLSACVFASKHTRTQVGLLPPELLNSPTAAILRRAVRTLKTLHNKTPDFRLWTHHTHLPHMVHVCVCVCVCMYVCTRISISEPIYGCIGGGEKHQCLRYTRSLAAPPRPKSRCYTHIHAQTTMTQPHAQHTHKHIHINTRRCRQRLRGAGTAAHCGRR